MLITKEEVKTPFVPIVITLQTQNEVDGLYNIVRDYDGVLYPFSYEFYTKLNKYISK